MVIEQPQDRRQRNGQPPVPDQQDERDGYAGPVQHTTDEKENPQPRGGINPVVIVVLKIALAVFIIISVIAQVWALPLVARRSAQDAPQYAPYATGYLLAVIAALACFEIGLIAVWRLASLSARGTVFANDSLIWVDIIIACVSIAALLALGLFIHTAFIAHLKPLAVPLGALLVALGLLAMLLLIIVLRALLVSATAQRDELEAVI
ncbi:DUF2975 domain-containing protein [Bifidobacterium apri]|uniref:DUF2975 domain-containing protein n=1 Tax=Bifidobacterium apri TaxID=1769423 RepID=A0A6A2VZP6_9BIFI|nr:DUF2975 domain-containing protein [Bifidobacterium apri]KAB8301754.1 hypothetical protein DSM100238_0073 [Bifidobacterium apri]